MARRLVADGDNLQVQSYAAATIGTASTVALVEAVGPSPPLHCKTGRFSVLTVAVWDDQCISIVRLSATIATVTVGDC